MLLSSLIEVLIYLTYLKFSFFRLIRGLGTETVAQVASGDRHSLALTKGGQLYTWGDHSFGQLGVGKISSDKTPTPQVSLTRINVV